MKSKIENTLDYNRFKILSGNRPIKQSNVNNIVSNFENGIDLFKYNPILVDSKFFIYDGQHRFRACEKLGIPIYYMIIDPMDMNSLVRLNNAQMKWSLEAYIYSFIEQGLDDYKILLEFSKYNQVGYSIASEMLRQESFYGSKKFTNGEFKVKSLVAAQEIAHWYDSLILINKKLKVRIIVRSLIELYKLENFNFSRLENKLSTHKQEIKVMGSLSEQLRYFETIYNHAIKNKSNYLRLF